MILARQSRKSSGKQEDGIRDRSPSRGLGDVYKRQMPSRVERLPCAVSGMTQCVLRLTGGASGITDCGDALAFGRI